MTTYINVAVVLFTAIGWIFFLGATVGVLRFPDFYTRMHAAGKGDTLSTVMILFGFAAYQLHQPDMANLLVAFKIIFIAVLIFISAPTATHAIMDAGFGSKIAHWGVRDGSVSHSLTKKDERS